MNSKDKSQSKKRRHSKEAVRTWLRLLSCEATVEQRIRGLFRSNFSVTLPQFDVLSELERAGKQLTMSELSTELMVSNGNVTGVIDRLEKSGFVRRKRAEHDRRIQYIELSSKGRKEFDQMAERHEGWLDDMFEEMTITDMVELQKLLLKMRRSVSSMH